MTDSLTAANQALEPLKYLGEVTEYTIWQFYQPAIEYAMLNVSAQGDIN
jgi:hypothetical protein